MGSAGVGLGWVEVRIAGLVIIKGEKFYFPCVMFIFIVFDIRMAEVGL